MKRLDSDGTGMSLNGLLENSLDGIRIRRGEVEPKRWSLISYKSSDAVFGLNLAFQGGSF